MTSIWQRNYYEHIIRGEHKWTQIQAYFAHNPAAWQSDPYHT